MPYSVMLVAGDGGYLMFSDARFERETGLPGYIDDAYWMTCTVSVLTSTAEETTDLEMIRPYRNDTIAFFDQISVNGWKGTDGWQSEYAKLAVSATGDAGTEVDLAIKFWLDRYEREVHTTLRVSVSALRAFATDLRDFMCVERPYRMKTHRPSNASGP